MFCPCDLRTYSTKVLMSLLRRRGGQPDEQEDEMTWQKSKAECKHGHPFTAQNTRIGRDGRRQCVECGRIRSREHQRRKRAKHRAEGDQGSRGAKNASPRAWTEPQEVRP
jgi:hypothetical protein